MENIISGKMSINPIAVKDLSKEELYTICKGNIADDFEVVWDKVCKANGNYENIGKPSKQGKRS